MRFIIFKWGFAADYLPKHDSIRVDVGLVGVGLRLEHLWRHPMESACKSSHIPILVITAATRQPEVRHLYLDEVLAALDWLSQQQIQRFEVSVQDRRLLVVQKVHSPGDVECHLIPLPPAEGDRELLMQRCKERAAEAVLRHDEHMAFVSTGAYKHHEVGMPHFE